MSILRTINTFQERDYGVNVLRQPVPVFVRGIGTNKVGTMGLLPWGPTNEIRRISDAGSLFETFSPAAFDAHVNYPAMQTFNNKAFPNELLVARVLATGALAADETFQDGVPADSVVVTGRYVGALGNQVSVAWVANATTAANRDMVVKIGTTYEATYENVVVDETGSITVNDPGDPYVTVAAAVGATAPPAVVADTLLTGGSDGAAVAGDFATTLALFADASQDWSVFFVADPPAALIPTINEEVQTFIDAHPTGFAVLNHVPGNTPTQAQAAVATLRTQRAIMPFNRPKVPNLYDPDRAIVEVDAASFYAAIIASIRPEQSPGGAVGLPYLDAIVGLAETATEVELRNLDQAGIAPLLYLGPGKGTIIRHAVTTSLTPGETEVYRSRMATYIERSIADLLVHFVERINDIDLANERLGPITGDEVTAIQLFLQGLQDDSRIKAYDIDPFSGNTEALVDAGDFVIQIAVELFSTQVRIVLRAQIGAEVQISSQ